MTDTATGAEIESEQIDLGDIIGQYRNILEGIADRFGNVLPPAIHNLETIRDVLRSDGSADDIRDARVKALEGIIENLEGLNDALRGYVRSGLLLYCMEGLNIQDLDLYNDVIEPVLEDHELAGKRHKKQVPVDHENSLESGVRIQGDLKHLRRVYEILFSNAIEHATKRTRFSYGIEDADGCYKLNVFNFSGKSIDGDIFEKDGLLKGVKRIIEAHKGEIWVESGEKDRRHYVNIVFTLPKYAEQDAQG